MVKEEIAAILSHLADSVHFDQHVFIPYVSISVDTYYDFSPLLSSVHRTLVGFDPGVTSCEAHGEQRGPFPTCLAGREVTPRTVCATVGYCESQKVLQFLIHSVMVSAHVECAVELLALRACDKQYLSCFIAYDKTYKLLSQRSFSAVHYA